VSVPESVSSHSDNNFGEEGKNRDEEQVSPGLFRIVAGLLHAGAQGAQ